MDKCRIVKHLKVNVGFESLCPSAYDAEVALRNAAGDTDANVVILTGIRNQGSNNCAGSATGIACRCDPDTLKAAGLEQ
jgi:hypothetical protein